MTTAARQPPFWAREAASLLSELGSSPTGLDPSEVGERLERFGPNLPASTDRHGTWRLLLQQVRSPIALLLLITAVLSAFLGEQTDAVIILVILIGSGLLGFWQERNASTAIAELLALIRTRALVRRAGVEAELPVEELVPGDIVVLNAGDLIPADCRLLEARDLNVDEASLTGEGFPVDKDPAAVSADAPLAERRSALFMGSHVVTGTGVALVVATGGRTVYGGLTKELERRVPVSEFERGVRRFGYFLLELTAALIVIVFAVNIWLQRPVLDVLLFTLALAVGLTPQLLPAIVSVTLASGARLMARKQVVVRRLVAIEDFGGMTLLATDKTGTLTEGIVRVRSSLAPDGQPDERVGRLAALNARLQSGFDNPVDLALRALPLPEVPVRKLDEVPYDFVRRRLSVLVEESPGGALLITKGAVPEVLSVCTSAVSTAGGGPADGAWQDRVRRLTEELNRQGYRCLGVATRAMGGATAGRDDEREMTFAGVIALSDPPKAGIRETLGQLSALGVTVKMITGDSHLVATAIAREVGMPADHVLCGSELRGMTDPALRRRAAEVNIFAEVDPNQKERIILALRSAGSSVGFLGDGINDAPALHAADVGISVDTAADATRQAADIVLLQKDLGVLVEGIRQGRRAFANTLKYVFITMSANVGNMVSMAVASVVTAFLPMLPAQILLLNLLSDLPAMAIATDTLDPELVERPRRWDVGYIRRFTLTFGLVSSAFDFLTFGLLLALAVPPAEFRTGWFLESLLTEIFVLLVIRTGRVFYRSRPSAPLLAASLAVAALAIALPYLPGTGMIGFVPLSMPVTAGLILITLGLVAASEVAKRLFLRHHAMLAS